MPSFKDAIKNRNQVKEAVKSQQEQVTPKTLEPKVEKVNAVSTLSKATASVKKFSEYIFKPGADHGKDTIFRKLGYNEKDSAKLAKMWEKQASEKFVKGEYTLGMKNEYGQRINIEIKLEGIGAAKGKTSFIKSGWMLQDDGTITLNTPFSGFTK